MAVFRGFLLVQGVLESLIKNSPSRNAREFAQVCGYYALKVTTMLGLAAGLAACTTVNDPPHFDLAPGIFEADVVLLGEVHDNPIHHSIQAKILQKLAERGKLGAVFFEQVLQKDQSLLDQLKLDRLDEADQLLRWQERGWPDFHMYRPIFKAALEAGVPLYGAQLPAESSKLIAKEGYGKVFTEEQQRTLGLLKPLPAEADSELRKLIREGHCGLLDPAHLAMMLPVQRAWDGTMALTYLQKRPRGTAVFIVGSGHARKDFGIPWYLRNADSQLKIWSVQLTESTSDQQVLSQVYEEIIVTASAQREDPCEGFRRHQEKSKKVKAQDSNP